MSGCYVVFHKQLGDLVLLEPALSRLREAHGEPIHVFTRGGHAPVLDLMPGVQFARGVALRPAADLYCFDPLSKSAFRSLSAPVLRRHLIVPEARELEWFHPWIFRRVPSPEIGDTYVAEFFWQHTPCRSSGEFRPPALVRPPDSWAPPAVTANSFVLINATSGWRMKMWMPGSWAKLIGELGCNAPCLLTNGGQGWQAEHCQRVVEQSSGRARILPSTLREFLWLCANARMVITVDGAASHLAAAFGTPVVTLFGPTNIHNWHRSGPRNVAVQAPDTGTERRHLRDLGTEPVLDAARLVSAAEN